MGGLDRRIQRLELHFEHAPNSPETDEAARDRRRRVNKYFTLIARWRREQAGLPVEDLPYTKEDYDDDIDTLERIIPRMREARGWQSGEAREFLDTWEDTTRKKLESYRKETANE